MKLVSNFVTEAIGQYRCRCNCLKCLLFKHCKKGNCYK